MRRGTRSRAVLQWLYGLALCAFAASPALAQQGAVITGRVTSDINQPVYNAQVYITELNLFTGTDQAGNFRLAVPAARAQGQSVMLRVRALGFSPASQTIRITAGNQTVNFSIKADAVRLNEVVTTGVAEGTERAKLPFSIGKVDAADLPAPSVSPLSQLQGRVAGANIVSSSGRPGASPQVLLRAPTSINASGRGQDPLYVVDGVVTVGSLPDINPSDIESVEVVKGAAAASLYGARAGNGVISITTKRGASGGNGVQISARAEYGQGDIEREFPLAQNHTWLMNADQSAFCSSRTCATTFNWMDEIIRLNSTSGALPLAPKFSPQNNGTTVWNTYQSGKWPGQTYNAIDQIINPGPFAQMDANVSGRVNNTNFFTSFGYLNQAGSVIGLQGFQRASVRANVDQRFGSAWSAKLSTYYSRSKDDGAGQEGNSFFDLTRMPRGVNLLAKDTVRNEYIIRPDLAGENENPVYNLVYLDRQDQSDRFLSGLNVQFQPVTWFDLKGDVSYDRSNWNTSQFNDKGFRTARSSSLNLGQVYRGAGNDQSFNSALTGTLRHEFSSDIRTSLTGRYSYEQQDSQSEDGTGRDLAVKSVNDLDNARSPQIFIGSGNSSVRRVGYFLNGVADLYDRYYIDALVRRDGSSLFGPDNRWANFGRVAASWRLTQEPWFKVPGLDEFKLRYSVGTAGNSPSFAAQYEVYQLSGGAFSPTTLGNRNLGPELVTENEAGVEMLVMNRIAATITNSRVVTKDQILPVPLPAASGFTTQWQNAGTMEGNTWEVTLDIPWVRRQDVTFNTRFTYDRSRAKITELNVPAFQYGVSNQGLEAVFYARKGENYGTMYGTKFATSCGDLPTGTDCSQFAKNSDGYFVYSGGKDLGSGVTKNADGTYSTVAGTWGTSGPVLAGRTSPVLWGVPIVGQDASGNMYLPLGHALPDYRWAFNPVATYKKLSATALFDASVGRSVYNQGRHWSYFENYSHDQDQADKPVAEVKPTGYYGSSGLYNVLQPNSHFIEDGSFVKLREMTLSYRVGRVPAVAGDWTLSVIGRNLKTWTDYTGFDPEVGITGGQSSSGVINAFDAYRFPNLRTVTFSVQASF